MKRCFTYVISHASSKATTLPWVPPGDWGNGTLGSLEPGCAMDCPHTGRSAVDVETIESLLRPGSPRRSFTQMDREHQVAPGLLEAIGEMGCGARHWSPST